MSHPSSALRRAGRPTRAGVEPAPTPRRASLVLLALALAGAAGVAVLCSRYGAGVAPDSVNYISAAGDLAAGRTPTRWDGGPFLFWPPLYPALLALLLVIGIPLAGATTAVSAAAFGLTVWLVGRVVERWTGRRELAWLAAGLVLLCPVLLRVATMAWSEPPFILFELVSLAALSEYLDGRSRRSLLMAAAAAGLAALTRYIGVVLVMAALPLLLGRPGELMPRRVWDATLYALVALASLGAWLVRNALLSGTLTGPRSWMAAAEHPPLFISTLSAAGWAGLVLLSVGGLVVGWRRGGEGGALRTFSLALAAYLAALLYFAFRGASNPLDYRLLAPAIAPAVVVSALLAARISLPRLLHPAVALPTLAAALVALGAGPATRMVRDGAGGYATSAWARSELIRFVQENHGLARLYSNAPEALYYRADVRAGSTPGKYEGFSTRVAPDAVGRFCAEVRAGKGPAHLAWFRVAPYGGLLVPLAELRAAVTLERVAAFDDGEVYRVLSCDDPAASARTAASRAILHRPEANHSETQRHGTHDSARVRPHPEDRREALGA